jgi:hypothetical protein
VEGLTSLFTDDAIFYDGGFVKLGQSPVSLKGKKDIKDFFKQTFSQFKIDIKNVVINGSAMRYDIEIGGSTVGLALGVMKEENNLIKEYRVEVG